MRAETTDAKTYVTELHRKLVARGLTAKAFADVTETDPFLWARHPEDASRTQLVVLRHKDGDPDAELAWHWQQAAEPGSGATVQLVYMRPAAEVTEAADAIAQALTT